VPLTKATTTTTRPKLSPLKATVLRVRIVNMVEKLASIFSRRKPQRGTSNCVSPCGTSRNALLRGTEVVTW
jgi:hypothetical protein